MGANFSCADVQNVFGCFADALAQQGVRNAVSDVCFNGAWKDDRCQFLGSCVGSSSLHSQLTLCFNGCAGLAPLSNPHVGKSSEDMAVCVREITSSSLFFLNLPSAPEVFAQRLAQNALLLQKHSSFKASHPALTGRL
jgi:hypothetical protein